MIISKWLTQSVNKNCQNNFVAFYIIFRSGWTITEMTLKVSVFFHLRKHTEDSKESKLLKIVTIIIIYLR